MFQSLASIGVEIGRFWMDMAVYLLLGFSIAGILSRLLKTETITRHLGANSIASSFKASLLGVPLPLCSCGVIPVGLSLFRRGASRSASVSFLISTPQTGVDSILVTWAMLGPFFAVVRPVVAFLNGLFGGLGVALTVPEAKTPGQVESNANCTDGSCAPSETPGPALSEGFWPWLGFQVTAAFRYGLLEFPREIAKWLVIGVVAAGLLSWALPPDSEFFSRYLGRGLLPMAVMALAGVPFYICATASVPFVAVLLTAGLSPGAALVFLMTGPATNLASLVVLVRTLGKGAVLVYLASIVLFSFLCGFVVDHFFFEWAASGHQEAASHHGGFAWWHWAGAVLMLPVIGQALWLNYQESRERKKGDGTMENEVAWTYHVEGMTCANCARHVKTALEALDGVDGAVVNHETGEVKIQGSEKPDPEALRQAVDQAGYSLKE